MRHWRSDWMPLSHGGFRNCPAQLTAPSHEEAALLCKDEVVVELRPLEQGLSALSPHKNGMLGPQGSPGCGKSIAASPSLDSSHQWIYHFSTQRRWGTPEFLDKAKRMHPQVNLCFGFFIITTFTLHRGYFHRALKMKTIRMDQSQTKGEQVCHIFDKLPKSLSIALSSLKSPHDIQLHPSFRSHSQPHGSAIGRLHRPALPSSKRNRLRKIIEGSGEEEFPEGTTRDRLTKLHQGDKHTYLDLCII